MQREREREREREIHWTVTLLNNNWRRLQQAQSTITKTKLYAKVQFEQINMNKPFFWHRKNITKLSSVRSLDNEKNLDDNTICGNVINLTTRSLIKPINHLPVEVDSLSAWKYLFRWFMSVCFNSKLISKPSQNYLVSKQIFAAFLY